MILPTDNLVMLLETLIHRLKVGLWVSLRSVFYLSTPVIDTDRFHPFSYLFYLLRKYFSSQVAVCRVNIHRSNLCISTLIVNQLVDRICVWLDINRHNLVVSPYTLINPSCRFTYNLHQIARLRSLVFGAGLRFIMKNGSVIETQDGQVR